MRYNSDYQPHRTISTDDFRPSLAFVWFDAAAGTITSTDAHILAQVNVTVDGGDVSGWIHPDAFKVSGMRKNTFGGRAHIDCSGDDETVVVDIGNGPVVHTRDAGATPPTYSRVIPSDPAPENRVVIGLDAALLLKLAQAVGSTETRKKDACAGVAIIVDTSQKLGAYQVKAITGPGKEDGENVALIMPMRHEV